VIEKYTFLASHLDVRSIACGGGSLAAVDPHSGGLRVGPESAGSDPGPACYGHGHQATVTDADVVLGLIDPDAFLGGRMTLDAERAARAVRRLSSATGLSLEAAAAGVLQVNANNAATLIRQRTIEQGRDPRDFVLYAFGGAGPLHAFLFAGELGVREVVIPLGNGASTLSAFGIAVSNATQVSERECSMTAPFDASGLRAIADALADDALRETVSAGLAREQLSLRFTALARYAGQHMHELLLALDPADPDLGASLEAAFAAEYTRLYGASALSGAHVPEIFAVRATATVDLGADHESLVAQEAPYERRGSRPVFWPQEGEWLQTAVHQGAPPVDEAICGPALVQLPNTTISVARGQQLHRDDLGNCVLRLDGGDDAGPALAAAAIEVDA
jgi:N-methylhydantoinase A